MVIRFEYSYICENLFAKMYIFMHSYCKVHNVYINFDMIHICTYSYIIYNVIYTSIHYVLIKESFSFFLSFFLPDVIKLNEAACLQWTDWTECEPDFLLYEFLLLYTHTLRYIQYASKYKLEYLYIHKCNNMYGMYTMSWIPSSSSASSSNLEKNSEYDVYV